MRGAVGTCPWCGGDAPAGGFTETCPRSIECPTCHSGPGSPCYRPSGHRAPQLHATRLDAAAALDVAPEPTGQIDIFGDVSEPLRGPDGPAESWSQPRRFEPPAVEGQLVLEGDE